VSGTAIDEYVELSERIAVEALFADRIEHLYARLDQLWYAEMSVDDRVEAQRRLHAKDQASISQRIEDPFGVEADP
jgi:hypothetical protein